MERSVRPDSADESKIIDLRQLGAMIDARGPGRAGVVARTSAVALPVFGADQLHHVPPHLMAPRVPPATMSLTPSVSTPQRGSDTTVLLVMIGALTCAVLSLAVYVVVSTPPPVVVESVASVAPVLADAEAPKLERFANDAVVAAPPPLAPQSETVQPSIPIATRKRPRRTGTRDRGKRTAREIPMSEADRPAPRKPPPAKPAGRGTVAPSAECVIDPKSCGLGATKPPPTNTRPGSRSPRGDLPEKLSAPAIRKAIARVRANAKACGAKYGGTAGEKVSVKLSIAGTTGRVTEAAPLRPHAGTPLGGCVAAALQRAQFDPFAASVQGVQYGVRL